MKIDIKRNIDEYIFILDGSLDIYTSLDLKNSIEENIRDRNSNLTIDMGKVGFIDSSGIGVLIRSLNYIQGLDGKLKLINLNKLIEKVFKAAGLHTYFTIEKPEIKTNSQQELIQYIKEDLDYCHLHELKQIYKLIRRLRHGQPEEK